jgi:hypothetical protein
MAYLVAAVMAHLPAPAPAGLILDEERDPVILLTRWQVMHGVFPCAECVAASVAGRVAGEPLLLLPCSSSCRNIHEHGWLYVRDYSRLEGWTVMEHFTAHIQYDYWLSKVIIWFKFHFAARAHLVDHPICFDEWQPGCFERQRVMTFPAAPFNYQRTLVPIEVRIPSGVPDDRILWDDLYDAFPEVTDESVTWMDRILWDGVIS